MSVQHRSHRLQGRIAEVSINGFRSLKSIQKLQLPQLTVLIGANGVGKSSFICFFEMLDEAAMRQNAHIVTSSTILNVLPRWKHF